jgi:hypothetical protein
MALRREEALKTIIDGLSLLATECKLRGLLHLFDSHTISHELFCRLLNEIFDIELVQTDRIKVNFPAIDLGDAKNKRCFQITTEKDGAKIQKTLDKYAEHRLMDQYGELQILVIGEKQSAYKSVNVPPAIVFNVDDDIIDLRDLLRQIETLSTEKLTRLARIVEEEIGASLAPKQQPQATIRVQLFPANPIEVSQLDLTRDIRGIKEKLRKTAARQTVDIVSSWAQTFDGFLQWLYTIQPRILQLSGGGRTRNDFILKPQQGDPVAVPYEVIRNLMANLRGKCRLVILDRCLSDTQAAGVKDEIECTISIPVTASAEASRAYLTTLYRAISFGESIRAAHDHAVSALQMEGYPPDTATLVSAAGGVPNAIVLVAPPPSAGSAVADSKISFVQIEMATDQCLWEEMRHHRAPEAPIYNPITGRPWFNQTYEVQPKESYPFGSHQLANYHWTPAQRESETRIADPILEFTIVNRSGIPTVVSRIGFRVSNVWNAAKAAPLAFRLVSYDMYELAVKDLVIGEDQLLRLPDPIYLEPNAPYRFRLRLKDYAAGAKKNETVIRLVVVADNDTLISDEIYLGIMWMSDSYKGHSEAASLPSLD